MAEKQPTRSFGLDRLRIGTRNERIAVGIGRRRQDIGIAACHRMRARFAKQLGHLLRRPDGQRLAGVQRAGNVYRGVGETGCGKASKAKQAGQSI